MKKLVITGATGLIGSSFIKRYHNHYKILGVKREQDSSLINSDALNIEFACSDYSIENLTELFENADTVIHLASRKVDPKGEKFSDYLESIEVFEKVCLASISSGIKQIINISSRCVYGPENILPYDEKQHTNPINLYGIAKTTMEEVSNYYSKRNSISIVNLRLSQVVSYAKSGQGLINISIDSAINGSDLQIYGKGLACRDYIYIKDVVAGIAAFVENPELCGIYNLGSGKGITIREVVDCIRDVFNPNVSVLAKEDAKEDLTNFELDMQKTNREAKFEVEYSFEEMLKDIKSNI